MKILQGYPASSGIISGTVCLLNSSVEEKIPHYRITEEQAPLEIIRLHEAFDLAEKQMAGVIENVKNELDKETLGILKSHLVIFRDKGLFSRVSSHINMKLSNAEHAVYDVFEEYISEFRSKTGHFEELAHDFIDIRNRIFQAFSIEPGNNNCPLPSRQPVIVAAKGFTPASILNVPRQNVMAFISQQGGITHHATILARAYGVPNVYGIDVEKELECGMEVIVDGAAGKVYIDPDPETREYYSAKIDRQAAVKGICDLRKTEPARTSTGNRVKLKLNISLMEEVALIKDMPHDGIGLLRTEFLFTGRKEPPEEKEQAAVYKRILDASGDRPVTVRMLDLGRDKLPVYFRLPEDLDPDADIRGGIAAEVFRDMYIIQAKALLIANNGKTLNILYPMVSDMNDLKSFKAILKDAASELKRAGVDFNPVIREGIMIETPAAAVLCGELLDHVDFANIGSNDLLQYTLAITRNNPFADGRYHILHPSILKMMKVIAEEGNRRNKEVCLCGELSFFEEHYPLLLKIGLRSFSVAVSKFYDIKCSLLGLDAEDEKTDVEKYFRLHSKEQHHSFLMESI